ncbi:hypothetical protein N7510_003148 [Penicillium lagena]|uniref:uncharacterized protein n=1 Tax=Penicillium lagena TaxID=94218 RepID=UPI00254159B2|nr:uncharacterized protein N7510_003148 [Penicillium lagena]KAJ5619164.1 hypothetical protein N7510_003148 [Penicillium lagena]
MILSPFSSRLRVRRRRRRQRQRQILRALIILSVLWNWIEVHWVHRRLLKADDIHHEQPRRRIELPQRRERVYIAGVNWNSESILRNHWNQAVLDLAQKLGPDKIFISIYESGSSDGTKGALAELDEELDRLHVPRNITTSPVTHEDEMNKPHDGDGWVKTSSGKSQLRRIPYLSRMRNLSLQPLAELAEQGIIFDKVLFLNDVVFTVGFVPAISYMLVLIYAIAIQGNDIVELLNTNKGNYAAACSLDFSKPPDYYDTFALRDIDGHETVMQQWPYFLAMPAGPFYAKSPLRFRGIPDSLASAHLEGSECCLIHADNRLSKYLGIYLNPRVRVGYNGDAYDAVNPTGKWLSRWQILRGLWSNRLRRWTSSPLPKEMAIRNRVEKWAAQSEHNHEPGVFCLVNEMQVLHPRGWAHVA